MISEQHRQQYLSLLGIQNWMPRKVLSAAKPSVLLPEEFLPEVLDQFEPTASNGSTSASGSPDETLQALRPEGAAAKPNAKENKQALANVKESLINAPKVAVPPVSVKPDAETQANTPRFALEIRAFESGLIIVSDGKVEGKQQALLVQINRAFCGQRQMIKDAHPFAWPLIDNGTFDQSEPIARTAVKSHVKKLQERQTIKMVLCLGHDATTYFETSWSEEIHVVTGSEVQAMFNEEDGIVYKKQLWEKMKSHCLGV